jgi:hypothetical protein
VHILLNVGEDFFFPGRELKHVIVLFGISTVIIYSYLSMAIKL